MNKVNAMLGEWTTAPQQRAELPAGDAALPLVDQAVLDRLTEELDDDAAYTSAFVTNFIHFLPVRIEQLRLALTTGCLEEAVTAVLSLTTSSRMVGAERLAGLASALEAELRSDACRSDPAAALPQQAARFLGPLTRCSTVTSHRLSHSAQRGPGQGLT